MRNNRDSSSSRQTEPKPEDMAWDIGPLTANSTKVLDKHRARWVELCTKYEATELSPAAQITTVLDSFYNAHWSEKPKNEDVAEPLGVAIGDMLKAGGEVGWVLANDGELLCIASPNGKVAVAPGSIGFKWLQDRTHPIDQLKKDVSKAVRDTVGEPVAIGFEFEQDEGMPQLR